MLQLKYQLGYLVMYHSAEKVNLLRVKQCACNCSQLLIVFRPFLVLSLNSLFVSVLEVIEFVLDCMEKSIEGIANILKGKKQIVKIFGLVTAIIPCGASGSSKTLGILPSTFCGRGVKD